jgi:hypothetical protein
LLGIVLLVEKIISGPLRFPFVLALAAFMLVSIALGPVALGRERRLLKLVACAGFFFIAILFVLSFADVLARLG